MSLMAEPPCDLPPSGRQLPGLTLWPKQTGFSLCRSLRVSETAKLPHSSIMTPSREPEGSPWKHIPRTLAPFGRWRNSSATVSFIQNARLWLSDNNKLNYFFKDET